MSTQPAAMTAADAEMLLLNNLYVPVLLEKVAEFGIVPQNEQDVVAIVKMAAQLRTQYEQAQLAGQTAHSSLLQKAAAHLDAHITGHQPPAEVDLLIKSAAKEAARVPQYAAAALLLAQASQAA